MPGAALQLTPEQERVVHDDRSVIVIGRSGTGKAGGNATRGTGASRGVVRLVCLGAQTHALA